jgi:hypothetical protein
MIFMVFSWWVCDWVGRCRRLQLLSKPIDTAWVQVAAINAPTTPDAVVVRMAFLLRSKV